MNSFEQWFASVGGVVFTKESDKLRDAYLAGLRRAVKIVHKTANMNSAFEDAIESEASLIEGSTGEKT
jgi:hypothetical protein